MPGHYPSQCRFRPRRREGSEAVEVPPARLFLCTRCRTQVLICSRCDRGQIYCAGSCAQEARRDAQRVAGRRYQMSRRGRLAHAARARRYRVRQKNVTHQGSPPLPSHDCLSPGSAVSASKPPPPGELPWPSSWRCHWCRSRCPRLVRRDFLRRRWVARTVGHKQRGGKHDHPP